VLKTYRVPSAAQAGRLRSGNEKAGSDATVAPGSLGYVSLTRGVAVSRVSSNYFCGVITGAVSFIAAERRHV
jgi:hypothetical protein